VTDDVPVRLVPVIVTVVPPAVGPDANPVADNTDVIVGAATNVKPLVIRPPPVVVEVTTSTAPAAIAGVTTVSEVELRTEIDVPGVPGVGPNNTDDVPVRPVPVIVTVVPPAVGPDANPVADNTEVMVCDAAEITSDAPSATAVVLTDVFTLNLEVVFAVYVDAAGLVIPAIVRVVAVLAARLQVPPKVIVTIPPLAVAVAVQLPPNAAPSTIVGVAGIKNVEAAVLNITVTVPEVCATVAFVKPTVHVVVANATCDAPEKVTAETEAACAGCADPNSTMPATAPASTKRRAWRKLGPNLTFPAY
jgi:hypothetical protein